MKEWLNKQKKNIKKGSSLFALIGLGLSASPQASYSQQMSVHEQAIQPMTLHVHANNLRVRSSPTIRSDNVLTTISEQDVYAVAQIENEGVLWFKIYTQKNGEKGFAYIAAKDKNSWFVSKKKELSKKPDIHLAKYCEFTAHWESSGLDNYSKEAYIDPTKDMKKYIKRYGNSIVEPTLLNERLKKLGISKKKVKYSIGHGTLLDNKITLHKRLKQLGLDKHKLITGKQHITKEQAYFLLEEEIKDSIFIAKKYIHSFDRLPTEARLILVDMAYNMSENTFKSFVNTIDAFNNFDFYTAAAEMKNSLWYNQTGNRALNHVKKMYELAQYAQSEKTKRKPLS